LISRISRRKDFDALRLEGRAVRRGPLRIRFRLATNSETFGCVRVAYGINRTVGNAVARNRLRRRIRAVIHDMDSREELPSGDYLIFTNPAAATATFLELEKALFFIAAELKRDK